MIYTTTLDGIDGWADQRTGDLWVDARLPPVDQSRVIAQLRAALADQWDAAPDVHIPRPRLEALPGGRSGDVRADAS